MRLSRFHLATVKEVPADAEIASHRLMLRAGMLRKHAVVHDGWQRTSVVFSVLDDEWPAVKAGLQARLQR